jgi:membrane fusion protein (multidrug efflux system)
MKIYASAAIVLGLVSLSLSGCLSHADSQDVSQSESEGSEGESEHEHKIVVTSPLRKDVVSTRPYVCQIHSCQHIEVRALQGGYLEKIGVKEGQAVKKGTLMFKINPILYQAKMESEDAEVQRIKIELTNAEALLQKSFLAAPEIAIKKADLKKAEAKLMLAQAELDFTSLAAPFDGIVDRQRNQLGSLIEEGDVLTTFSDNSVMWVYFNVPEARYLEYKAELDNPDNNASHLQIELKLANGKIFPQKGKISTIEADFNNTTGNISFRADFPNPDGLLRNGQTGTVLIHRKSQDVLVIPQRAKFDILARPYVYVVDKDNVVHQRDITIHSVQDDIYVIEKGLDEGDKIVLEGLRQVRDGGKIEYEFQAPEKVLGNLKYHAE